mgnify:CR=1 FL=1|jgi:hypothetical protein
MTVEFNNEELRELVLDSYDLMLSIPSPSKRDKYEIKSRGKIKNLPEALREFEDPQSSVTHFIKSATYFLPRSDSKLSDFLDTLLEKVQKIQATEKDPERIREKIRYLIGYNNWGMDAVCYIFKETENDNEVKIRLQRMIGAEMKTVGAEENVSAIVEKIMKWKANGDYKGENRRL